jgi:hypothetical protein
MDTLMDKQTIYGSVAFDPKGRKLYNHYVTLSDGSPLEIKSSVSVFHTNSVEAFKQEAEVMLARRKLKERYLAKKAKQASE